MIHPGAAARSDAKRPVSPRGLTLPELEKWVRSLGLPSFRGRQIFAWIHAHGVTSTQQMTDLSKELRGRLVELVDLAPLEVETVQRASDGTQKLRLRCSDGAAIETVLIPEEKKITQCLSTQVGCGLRCAFCASGAMGLSRDLSPGEIVDQIYRGRGFVPEGAHVSNLVFMGMGEPLNNLDHVLTAVEILCSDLGANYSPRRITLSTAGVVPAITELGRRARHLGLAVSLNATTDEVRDQLMPINRRWPLPELMAVLRSFPLPRRRRITFEYVLLAGINDTLADAHRLPKLLSGIPSKINLISYNPSQTAPFKRPDEASVEFFAESLREKGLPTYVRKSRGGDIAAACGQLVGDLHGQSS